MDEIKIPPFIDAHIHFVVDGKPVPDGGILKIKDNLLRHGVIAVNDMGYKGGDGLRAKKIIGDKILVRSAGFAIYRKGTYGVFLGKGISEKWEIKDAIKAVVDAGADFIKVINSGIVCAKKDGLITPGGFSLEELKIICDEARRKGLEIACHVNGDDAVRNAVIAGVSSIEHGYFVSNETLHMLKDKNIRWTPTVFALKCYSSILSGNAKRYIDEVIDNHMQSINYASSIGVRLNVGTDSGSKGVRHGESFFEELRLFKKAGLSLRQILSAACMSEHEIDKGNYLIVKEDFINTKKIEVVFSGGRQIFSDSFSEINNPKPQKHHCCA